MRRAENNASPGRPALQSGKQQGTYEDPKFSVRSTRGAPPVSPTGGFLLTRSCAFCEAVAMHGGMSNVRARHV
jgi:hypothetical protein